MTVPVLVAVGSPSDRFRRSRAIVIGVDAYGGRVPPLRSAVRDALEVGRRQGTYHGFTVEGLFDRCATRSAVRALLRETLPAQLVADDRLVVFVASHGVSLPSDDGRPAGYLLLQDAVRDDLSSFLPMHELHDALTALPCRHLLVILDCCFAGAFRWASQRDVATVAPTMYAERYEHFVSSPAWQVLTSTASDQRAFDLLSDHRGGDAAGHSPFAAALLDGISGAADLDGDGLVTASELYLYTRGRVERHEAQGALVQTPGLFSLEELATLNRHGGDEVVAFQTALAEELRRASGLHLVVTVRADVEPRFQDGPLARWWNEGRSVVLPMTRAEPRAAIEGQAAQIAMTFEPATLVERLIDDVASLPTPLPLLSFTLGELYRAYWRRLGAEAVVRDRALRETDYLAFGSVARSLTKRADEVYAELARDAHFRKLGENLVTPYERLRTEQARFVLGATR